jgi:endonuclease/exonuclease/phosphatase family metal-dependent hydrolase
MKLFACSILLMIVILWGCKTDKSPTSVLDDPDPNGEEELLKVFKETEGPGIVKVMSRNVYIGTDVDIVLGAPSVETIPVLVAGAYDLLQKTDFPSRAEALVTEIEKTLPHLIGLQEMSKFYIQSPGDIAGGGTVPATDKFLDFFEVLTDALQARGLEYEFVAEIKNADVELPMFVGLDGDIPLLDDVRIVDHDVILARSDVTISNPIAVRYDSMLVVEEAGIAIPRGYVAVTADIGPISVKFANTHIEAVPDIDLRLSQVGQLLDAFKNESLPVILAGDFNSRATTGNSYNLVLSEGYTDIWIDNPLTYNVNGYTYGHESDLRNDSPNLGGRIDFIFVSAEGDPVIGEGFVLGDEKRDKTANGLWPSDHAGVVSKLTYPVPSKLASN